MFSLLAFLGTALGVNKDAWNVPPHQLLAFFVSFAFALRYPKCQFSFTGITRSIFWLSPFVGNERHDF
jgi:hypothetical protein